MYLIKTALEGTQFTVKFVANQKNQMPVSISESTRILGDAKILTKFPIGTHFIVSDISWGEIDSKIVGTVRPMFYDDMIYAGSLASDNTPTNADVEYLMDWMISNSDYRCEGARKYAAKFVELGYSVDVEGKCKDYVEDSQVLCVSRSSVSSLVQRSLR